MNELLLEILAAREARAARQQAFLREYRCSLVCFTMNIAGPVKTSPLIRRAFDAGLTALKEAIAPTAILGQEVIHPITGDEAILAVDMDADELKSICTSIEEAFPMGRLFDMDVLNVRGEKLERTGQRGCLVCGAPGRSCSAGRLHTVEQLQKATRDLIAGHFDGMDAHRIAREAVNALVDEVRTTPKPGLVDLRNTGSHRDMDISLFTASAQALHPYFLRCAIIGQSTASFAPPDVFPLLRRAGLEAEEAMFAATGGVNTHKGAIYTLGVLCAAVARLWHTGNSHPGSDIVLALCAEIAGPAAEADLAQSSGNTAGERLYRQFGIRGIRGEMAEGLPSLSRISLPAFRDALARGYDRNHAGAIALLHLIAQVQDTTLYHRGGAEGASFAAEAARTLLLSQPYPEARQMEELDDAFIARNLSPGGCADLLAATYFLDALL